MPFMQNCMLDSLTSIYHNYLLCSNWGRYKKKVIEKGGNLIHFGNQPCLFSPFLITLFGSNKHRLLLHEAKKCLVSMWFSSILPTIFLLIKQLSILSFLGVEESLMISLSKWFFHAWFLSCIKKFLTKSLVKIVENIPQEEWNWVAPPYHSLEFYELLWFQSNILKVWSLTWWFMFNLNISFPIFSINSFLLYSLWLISGALPTISSKSRDTCWERQSIAPAIETQKNIL